MYGAAVLYECVSPNGDDFRKVLKNGQWLPDSGEKWSFVVHELKGTKKSEFRHFGKLKKSELNHWVSFSP